MNKKVGIAELKSRLSYYLKGVRRGHSVVVYDRDTPVALLSPIAQGPQLSVRAPTIPGGFTDFVPSCRSSTVNVDILAFLQEERDD